MESMTRMTWRLALVASLVLAIPACTPIPKPQGRECWLHTLDRPGKPKNQIMLCRSGVKARLRIYFPNNPWLLLQPTVCSARGTATQRDDGGLAFAFAKGPCANGRTLRPERYDCAVLGDGLRCRSDDLTLVFERHPGQAPQQP